jgi:hypothetical protein
MKELQELLSRIGFTLVELSNGLKAVDDWGMSFEGQTPTDLKTQLWKAGIRWTL